MLRVSRTLRLQTRSHTMLYAHGVGEQATSLRPCQSEDGPDSTACDRRGGSVTRERYKSPTNPPGVTVL